MCELVRQISEWCVCEYIQLCKPILSNLGCVGMVTLINNLLHDHGQGMFCHGYRAFEGVRSCIYVLYTRF